MLGNSPLFLSRAALLNSPGEMLRDVLLFSSSQNEGMAATKFAMLSERSLTNTRSGFLSNPFGNPI